MNTKAISILAGLALAGPALMTPARAGDREWAVAGKVLTGVVAAGVVARALEPAPYHAPTTAVVYQTAPRVVYAAPPPPPVIMAPQVAYYPAPVYVAAPRPFPVPVYVAAPICVGPRLHGHLHGPVFRRHVSVCW